MSRPADVLANYAQDTGAFRVPNKAATELAEACAAVVELVKAADAGDPDSFGQILFDERAAERLLAAIARVKGGAL